MQRVLQWSSKVTSGRVNQSSSAVSNWILPSKGGAQINGRWYTQHALERMAPKGLLKDGTKDISRGVPPSVVENAIEFGTKSLGNTANEIIHAFENVRVVTDVEMKRIITVILIGK